jgi:hypothetical protein
VPATRALISAELERQDRLAEVLDAVVPADWPPEGHGVDTLRFWLNALWQSGAAGCWRSSWERGAEVVVAHRLSHLEPSVGVL